MSVKNISSGKGYPVSYLLTTTKYKLSRYMVACSVLALLSGCTLTPGMSARELPDTPEITALPTGINLQVQNLDVNVINALDQQRLKDPTYLLPLFNKMDARTYVLKKGDVLGIYLWAYPEITPPISSTSANVEQSGYKIDQYGKINFPLIKEIQAEGKTASQLIAELNRRLSRYLKDPDTQVKVLRYEGNKFFVGGAVRNSGQFVLNDVPLSLYGAISLAGGLTELGDINSVTLQRNGQSYDLNLSDLKDYGLNPANLIINNGDSIYVAPRENRKIYVLGETGRTTPILMRDQRMTLGDVIGEGEGINASTASAGKVYLLRDNQPAQMTNVYQLDLTNLGNLALAQRFRMQPNDIVYVDPTGLARWNRVINLLLPSTNAIRTGQVIGGAN